MPSFAMTRSCRNHTAHHITSEPGLRSHRARVASFRHVAMHLLNLSNDFVDLGEWTRTVWSQPLTCEFEEIATQTSMLRILLVRLTSHVRVLPCPGHATIVSRHVFFMSCHVISCRVCQFLCIDLQQARWWSQPGW